MKFEISRVSLRLDTETKPHDKAMRNEFKGRWEIEVNTLEELLELGGDVILLMEYREIPLIKMFDDFV